MSNGQSFVKGEEIWLAPCRGSLQMKISQIFRSISDPGAFIIQQVTWTGELKFQYIGSDLYSRIKWLESCNLTSWTSLSLRKTVSNQPQRHLLHSFHVCGNCCTEGLRGISKEGFYHFCKIIFLMLTKKWIHLNDATKTINSDVKLLLKYCLCKFSLPLCGFYYGNCGEWQFYLIYDSKHC